jgi:hypothetical protein
MASAPTDSANQIKHLDRHRGRLAELGPVGRQHRGNVGGGGVAAARGW